MKKRKRQIIDFKVTLRKRRRALIKDLFDCIEILNLSCLICNTKKCFLNVIAIQLRIILCDGDNSLALRLWEDVSFHPLKKRYLDLEGTFVHDDSEDLFDKSKGKMPLKRWLKEPLIYNDGNINDGNAIDIEKAIKLIGDKSGAHIDKRQPIGLMFLKSDVNNLGIKYLVNISVYVIKELLALIEKEQRSGTIFNDNR